MIRGETHYQDCRAGTPQAHQRCTLANKENDMNTCHQARARIVSSRLYLVERQLGMLALIGLVLLSNFPGPTQGSADKSEAPPEDVSKAKP